MADMDQLITGVLQTSFGDSNLDGIFDSSDLVHVFQAGEYEDAVENNSTWETGDWNGDQEFDSSDIVFAFQSGGYVAAAMSGILPEFANVSVGVFSAVTWKYSRFTIHPYQR
jgi:hypothetical protein